MLCNIYFLWNDLCYITFLSYVRLKFMSSDILRIGNTSFIFTFKDVKTWKRCDSYWQQHSHAQLLPHYCVETQKPSQTTRPGSYP